jgi:hypothetical protein
LSRWSPGAPEVPLFLEIAAGVFIGVLAAAFVIWRVWVWQVEQLAAEARAALQQSVEQTTKELRQTREAAQQRELAERIQNANAQRAQEEVRRQAAAEAARREAAWQAYYRKPPSCDESRGGAWSVDCANEFMRAKKRFAELYDAGKL